MSKIFLKTHFNFKDSFHNIELKPNKTPFMNNKKKQF